MEEFIIKISLSLLLGLVIGIDRQIKHKPLGLKTSMVICVASCLVTIVSVESFFKYSTEGMTTNMDPMRLAAQIVSGVGFLGAGVILRRNNDVISGLTTAAMIWAASGLGIAIGAGFYLESFYAVLLILVSVNIIPTLLKLIGPRTLNQDDIALKVVMEPNLNMTELLEAIEHKGKQQAKASESKKKKRKKKDIKIRSVKVKDLEDGNQLIDLKISVPSKMYITEIYYITKNIKHVKSVNAEKI
ncbi:MgtC/SapB family protein [Alkalihalobacillus pseudalcaliphilus]|uniref:MgtC/SapB family protein n=1 Tax=Alkalihalobacillus pseudalcaliphilus TaxID=79884 RepID=UPI00064DEC14|nr:MgtC/SapB family protein [Alkalihalobacillus pseudalcaliphilus]KMK74362.1 methyltransferase [Alkalihalobacillus pseudalcaliphilus]